MPDGKRFAVARLCLPFVRSKIALTIDARSMFRLVDRFGRRRSFLVGLSLADWETVCPLQPGLRCGVNRSLQRRQCSNWCLVDFDHESHESHEYPCTQDSCHSCDSWFNLFPTSHKIGFDAERSIQSPFQTRCLHTLLLSM